MNPNELAMTAEQISRELRHIEATYVTPPKRLCELADAVDALKQPPIPPTLEQAAQEAAEAIQDLCGATLDRHCGLPFAGEMRQIILAHVAPCCGVNRELRDALMHVLRKYDAQSTQTKAKETDINQTIERLTI